MAIATSRRPRRARRSATGSGRAARASRRGTGPRTAPAGRPTSVRRRPGRARRRARTAGRACRAPRCPARRDGDARDEEEQDDDQHPEREQLLAHPGAALAVVDAAERGVERAPERAGEPDGGDHGHDPHRGRGLADASQAVEQGRLRPPREQPLEVLEDRRLDVLGGEDAARRRTARRARAGRRRGSGCRRPSRPTRSGCRRRPSARRRPRPAAWRALCPTRRAVPRRARRDDLGDPQAELLVDHHDLAARDRPAVDQQVDGLAGQAVERDDRARAERQRLADRSCACGRSRRPARPARRAGGRARRRVPGARAPAGATVVSKGT